LTIQRNLQDEEKQQKVNTISVGHHFTQANTINVNKTWALPHTTGNKDEPNLVSLRKSTHGTQNVKTQNKTTQKTKIMSNTDPPKLKMLRVNSGSREG